MGEGGKLTVRVDMQQLLQHTLHRRQGAGKIDQRRQCAGKRVEACRTAEKAGGERNAQGQVASVLVFGLHFGHIDIGGTLGLARFAAQAEFQRLMNFP